MPPKARAAAAAAAAASGPPDPSDPSGPPAPPRQRGKPRGIRRDRDCITCKSRNTKCDLNRPQCLPCVQAGITCGGYPLRVVWLDDRRRGGGGGSKAAMSKASSSSSSQSTPSQSSPSQPQSSLPPPPPPRPRPQPHASLRSLPAISSLTTPPATSPSTLPHPPPPPPPPSTDEPTATSPQPGSSGRSPTSVASPSITGDEAWCETDQNSLIKRLAALCSHILTTEDIHATAHNHYLAQPETTALLSDLCVFIQARLEGRHAPSTNAEHSPRAAAAATAAAATAAATAAAAAAIKKAPESLDMVRSRLTALARVNRAIEAANPFAFLGIATFAVFEVCDDTFGEWQCHLHGARHLLEYHRCRTLADLQRLATLVPGLMSILARLVWFDLNGSVVRSSVGNCGGVGGGIGGGGIYTPALIFEDWHRHVLLDADIFETVGISPDTCALYVDIAKARLVHRPVQACLRAAEQILKLDELPSSSSSSGDTHASGGGTGSSNGTGTGTGNDWDWAMAKNVHRCAAALAVLGQVQAAQDQALAAAERSSRIRGNPPHPHAHHHPDVIEDRQAWEATTCAAVDKLCAALSATPPSSRFYIHLAVGAYMAGMRARTPEHCAAVRQYWLNCSLSGVSRYPGGLSRCNEHWRRVGLLRDGEAGASRMMP